MGRGLSDLQKEILICLSVNPPSMSHRRLGFLLNGEYASPSERSALSRSVARLHERDLVELYADGEHVFITDGSPQVGFVLDCKGPYRTIKITDRGLAYLHGDKLPPLDPIKMVEEGKCWCGADISRLHKSRKWCRYDHVRMHPIPSKRHIKAGIMKAYLD